MNMKPKYKIIAILIFGLCSWSIALECPETEFECKDKKRCIGKGFVCDDFPNCLDRSDEDPKFCETWDYEYTDPNPEPAGWFPWAGGSEEEGGDANEDDYTEDSEKEDKKESSAGVSAFDSNQGSFSSFGQTFAEETISTEARCSLNQCVPKGVVNFQDGKEYRFKYEVLSKTGVRGGLNQTSSMLITGDVIVQALTACEFSLKIENMEFKTSSSETNGNPSHSHMRSDQESDFLQAIQRKSMRFSMLSGEIDFVCPSLSDDPRTLNFKKGVISMLQNSMPKLHLPHTKVEKDIVGECEMNYDFEGSEGPRVVVSKSRNIPSCNARTYIISAVQGVPYSFPNAKDSIPITESTSKCTQEIKAGLIMSASCKEEHILTPFNSEQGGIITSLDQILTFVSDTNIIPILGSIKRRTDISFDHHDHFHNYSDKGTPPGSDDAQMLTIVANLLDLSLTSKETPNENNLSRTFSYLVAALRAFRLEQMQVLHRSRTWKSEDRQLFYDALAMTGTSSSVQFMVKEIPNIEDASVVQMWIQSLAYIQSPDEEVIRAAGNIITIKNIPNEVLLFTGSLLNNYCLSHSSCSSHDSVMAAMDKFRTIITSNCRAKSFEQKLKILMALRGLGNAGLATNDVIHDALNSCILEGSNELELRTASVEAFRRAPCNVSRSSLQSTFSNPNEDSELRISSYLGLMRCANYETIHLVENVFRVEEVNQVGSFVWTHLQNLQETGSPSKAEIQSLLSNRNFEEKFKSDFRKFSKNIEWSGFYDEMNVGGSIDSNIIFSQKSYVPRSTTFNLTADLFGQSFNIFEVGARLENLERYIEKFLLSQHHQTESENEIKNKRIKKLINRSTRNEDYFGSELEMSLRTKVFGNDVSYHYIHGFKQLSEIIGSLSPAAIKESLKSGKEFNLKRSWFPLDSSYRLATTAGLPLKIGVEGSASIDVSASIQVDITSLFNLNKGKIVGHVKPTVSLDLRASMILDGYASQSGVEMDSSMHSSTFIDGTVEIDGKNVINIDLNFPTQSVDIFKASSKLVLLHGSSKSQLDKHSLNQETIKSDYATTFEAQECSPYGEIFGSKLCWSMKYPDVPDDILNPKILLHGPVQLGLVLKKDDPSLHSYKFRYQWENTDQKLHLYLLFDTPGSSAPREHSFKFEINYSKNEALMDLKSPYRSIDAKGRYIWMPEEKRLDSSVNVDGKGAATFSVGYKIYHRNQQRILLPTLQVNWRGIQLMKVSGDLEAREKTNDAESVHYSVRLEFEVDTSGKGQRGHGSIGGTLSKDRDNWDAKLDIRYSIGGSSAQERIRLDYKRIMKTGESLLKMDRSWKIHFSQFPNLNCKGKWASKNFHGSIENAVKINFGRDFENPETDVDLFHNLIFYGGNEQTTFNSTIALKYPKNKLDVVMGFDLYQDIREINTGFIFQTAKANAMTSRFHLIRSFAGPVDTEGYWHLRVPTWIDLKAKGKIKEIGIHSYEFDFEGSISPSQRLELIGYYTDLSTRIKSLHKLEMKIKLPSRQFIFSNSTFLLDMNQFAFASQIKTMNGDKYKVQLAYISQMDDLMAHQRKIEIDVFLPTQTYYWHSEITFGEYITISNDVHIDRYRDINLWLQMDKKKDRQTNINLKFLWDANRDPHKKAVVEIVFGNRLINLKSTITFLGNEYQAVWASTREWTTSEESLTFWSHRHAGEISWKDEKRKIHKITGGASFTLTREDKAHLLVNAYLTTPFEEWSNNSLIIEYSRGADSIVTSLKSRWHHNEFLNANIRASKEYKGNTIKAECKAEVYSFINENVVSLSAGTSLSKSRRMIDSNAFIQWDKDKVEFIIEAKDESGPGNVRMSILAKALTTLKGYNQLAAFVDLYGAKGSFSLHSSAKWEDILYEIKSNGELYSSQEYLKGEIILTTPDYGSDAAWAKLRVYHDPESHSEKMTIIGRWLEEEILLEGRVLSHPKKFKAELMLETPFEKLSQASITLGHSTEEFYLTEAKVKWNNTKNLGFEVISKTDSLTDFLMSANIMTPFPKYKEIRGELRNLFVLSPNVHVFSKIFGQLDEKKYGLGGRYEQGESPRLRVGLELYYPTPDLEEIKFDIADNSTLTNMRYNLEMRYGSNKDVRVATDFKKTEDSLEVSLISGINLSSFLGTDLKNVKVEGYGKLYWSMATDYELKLASITPTNSYQIFTKGTYSKEGKGSLEGSLTLPVYLNDVEYKCKYRKPTDYEDGYLDAKVTSSRKIVLEIRLEGKLKNVILSFKSPIENFRSGNLEYKLIPEDILRSKLAAKASLEDKEFSIDGVVYLHEDKFISKMEVILTTPLESFNQSKLTLEGRPDRGGYLNSFTFEAKEIHLEGEMFFKITSESDFAVTGKVTQRENGSAKNYKGSIAYTNVVGRPFTFSLKAESPGSEYNMFNLNVYLQKINRPYNLAVEWVVTDNSGKLELILERIENARVLGSMILNLVTPEKPSQNYKWNWDLNNRSTRDTVNLNLNTEMFSSHQYWDHFLVNGALRQVTSEPGLLQVYLLWPKLNPVNFSASASYASEPSFDLRTTVDLDLTNSSYGFVGGVLRKDHTVNLLSELWRAKNPNKLRETISFTADLDVFSNEIDGKCVLKMPMVKGFENNAADIKYKEGDFKDFRMKIEAGKTTTIIHAYLKSNQLPVTEGNASISSSLFWEGNPITLNFKQALADRGYSGNYNFDWPTWDLDKRTYEREFVNAILNHRKLKDGHEGTLDLISPLTKGKPITLSYTFKIPMDPEQRDILIKLGILYGKLKFGIKGEHTLSGFQNQQVKNTSLEIDNILWPFGIAYIEQYATLSSNGRKIDDELVIYDLDDVSRRSSISVKREKNARGGRLTLKGKLVAREIEVSTGYKSLGNYLSADFLVTWAPDQKIECVAELIDKGKTPKENSYLLNVRISNPLRTVLLEVIFVQNDEGLFADLTLNTDLEREGKKPLKAVLQLETLKLTNVERHQRGSLTIGHSALKTGITVTGELKRNVRNPLILNLVLRYSTSSDKDLIIDASVTHHIDERKFVALTEISHRASNLFARTNGEINYGLSNFSYFQDFRYKNEKGMETVAHIEGGLDLKEKTINTLVEASERIFDLKMKVKEKEKGLWEVQAVSKTHRKVPLLTSLRIHSSQPIFTLTIENLHAKNASDYATLIQNPDYPKYFAEKIIIEGGLEDQRYVHFHVKHLPLLINDENESSQLWMQDADFLFKLNNTKLISSHLLWRKRIEEEFWNEIGDIVGMTSELQLGFRDWLKEAVKSVGKEAFARSKPIFLDVLQTIAPVIQCLKNDTYDFKNDFYYLFKNMNLTEKETNLKLSVEFTVKNLAKSLNDLEFVKRMKENLSKGTLRVQIINVIEKIENFYQHLLTKDPSAGGLLDRIKQIMSSFATAYDQAAKKWYLTFRNAVTDFRKRLTDWLTEKWHNVYYNYKPHILRSLHLIESASYNGISKFWSYVSELGSTFKSISYVQNLEEIYSELKSLYQTMSTTPLKQNLELVYKYFVTHIRRGIGVFIIKVLPFMEDWVNEASKAWQKLYSYQNAQVVIDFSKRLIQRTFRLLSEIDYRDHLLSVAAFSIENGYTILTQTAIEAQLKHSPAKTEMIWTPDKGVIIFNQKLPMDWMSLNQQPQWEDLMEIPVISPLKRIIFPSTKFSVLDTWYRYFNLNFEPFTWIPPFTASGYVIGDSHILSFDGKLINYKGSCEHVLAADLIYGRWAVTIKYNAHTPKIINIYTEGKVIEFSKQFKVKIDRKLIALPHAISSTFISRTDGSVQLRQLSGLEVKWNLIHDVVSVIVPRTHFLNTAGLLGTNNNEPTDDFQSPDGKIIHDLGHLKEFIDGWDVSDGSCDSQQDMTSLEVFSDSTICHDLFVSKTSPFRYCFYQVNPLPYFNVCKESFKGHKDDTSPSALAYREACQMNAVPIKLPVSYVRCEYKNASDQSVMHIQEGQTIILKKDEIVNSVDVVILTEMKNCNRGKLQTKQFHRFVSTFNDGLHKAGVVSARYTIVAYGGSGAYSYPSVVASETQIFTSVKDVVKSLENLDFPLEDAESFEDETFSAIIYASNLAFRSPVNVMFLLFPCTPCESSYELDYSTMYHILLNNAVTLHVFKNGFFDVDKESVQKKVIGFDNEKAFTIQDYKKKTIGEAALRKQISPPKEELGMCLPLAIETNGSVYSSETLNGSKKKQIERFGLVVGRRVGQNAKKNYDERCLCLSTQEVTPLMRCDKWENGDISILERYGLSGSSKSAFLENSSDDEAFYVKDH